MPTIRIDDQRHAPRAAHQPNTSYTVRSGDTLWDIALDHHVSLGELLAANPQIPNPDFINAGQLIHLPQHRAPSRMNAGHSAGAWTGEGHGSGSGSGPKPALSSMGPAGIGGGYGSGTGAAPKPKAARAAEGSPKWFQVAAEEERHFMPGRQSMYHSQSRVGCYGQDWCSVFVNWVMQRVGYTGTMNAMASSWMDWGVSLHHPRRGAIVVLDDGYLADPRYPNNPYCHVAFVDRFDGRELRCLGGNQSNAVTYATYRLNHGPVVKGSPQRLHFRWPPR